MSDLIPQVEATALVKTYLDELSLRDELALSTISKYKQCITAYLSWLGQQDISDRSARLFLAHLRDQGFSSSSRRLYYASLKPFLHFLNIELKIKFKRTKRLPAYYSGNDLALLLQAVTARHDNWAGKTTERDQLIILMLAFTGMRRAELLNLRVMDINFQNRCIYVRSGKGDKDRAIPIASTIDKSLFDYIHKNELQSHDRLFPLQPKRIYTIVKRYSQLAGIDNLSPHGLRHYFATALLERGASIKAIQELLGHADISTTAIYLDLVPHHLASAIELLDERKIDDGCQYSQKD